MKFLIFAMTFVFLAWCFFDAKKNYFPALTRYPYVSGAGILWVSLILVWSMPFISMVLVTVYALHRLWYGKV